jgi:hypothetical protein
LNDPPQERDDIEGALKRGDKITVQVTPYDGEAYGRSVSLSREIANWPPVFLEHKEFSFDDPLYTYQAKASDPDGDPLIFSLASAQAGMAIDPSSGVLTWTVPSDFKGRTVSRSSSATATVGRAATQLKSLFADALSACFRSSKHMNKPVILASIPRGAGTSPAGRDRFTSDPADVDERILPDETPRATLCGCCSIKRVLRPRAWEMALSLPQIRSLFLNDAILGKPFLRLTRFVCSPRQAECTG